MTTQATPLTDYQRRLLRALASLAPTAAVAAAALAEALDGVTSHEAQRVGRNGNATRHLCALARRGYVQALDARHWTLTERGRRVSQE